MAKVALPALLLLLLILVCSFAGNLTAAAPTTEFIRSSCRATRYPDLCYQSLAAYGPAVRRSPRELARVALTVSADRARSASDFVSGLCKQDRSRSGGPVQDCIENMADSVDRLRQAAEELNRMGRAGSAAYTWHINNVQTWCSAALTDENTCLDGVSHGVDPATRKAIRGKVVEVAQVTSNALALVNRVGYSR